MADATSLDCVGLPVFISVRARGNPVRFHAGKGLNVQAAYVGAMMEAFEHAMSEQESEAGGHQNLSLLELDHQWPSGLTIDDFALKLGTAPRKDDSIAVLRCENLTVGESTMLPAELVMLPAQALGAGTQLFGCSSSGLASGNSVDEATVHGLMEVLEHDAVAMSLARNNSGLVYELPPPFDELARQWDKRGISLHVRHLPSDSGLPCFEATLHQADAEPRLMLSQGRGLHLDRGIALARAICEAAQTRVVTLYARHPDLPGASAAADRLGAEPTASNIRLALQRISDPSRRRRFVDLPHFQVRSVEQARSRLMTQVAAAKMGPVFRYALNANDSVASSLGLHAVRTILARSEINIGTHPRVGPRQRAVLMGTSPSVSPEKMASTDAA